MPDHCPRCGRDRNYVHERDGSQMCWCVADEQPRFNIGDYVKIADVPLHRSAFDVGSVTADEGPDAVLVLWQRPHKDRDRNPARARRASLTASNEIEYAYAAVAQKPCRNVHCSVSSGIHNEFTFGSGKLDFYGFWQYPCGLCARDHERRHPEDGTCWPYADSTPSTPEETS